MSKNVGGFNFDRDYELQIKYKGKQTGLTFEFYNDLQKYVDEGIFVDELNDGFSADEKRGLADTFMRIHKEKGYNTNFSKMKANEKFVYTAQDYIELARSAGYVLKDLSPEDQEKLMSRIEKSAEEFSATEQTEEKSAEEPQITSDADNLNPGEIKPLEFPTMKIETVKVEPVKINLPIDVLPENLNPSLVVEPEADKKADEVPDANPNGRDLSNVDERSKEEIRLPQSFLRRYRNEQGDFITPDNFKELSQDKQNELVETYQKMCNDVEKLAAKANKRNLFTKIFGGNKQSDIAKNN